MTMQPTLHTYMNVWWVDILGGGGNLMGQIAT